MSKIFVVSGASGVGKNTVIKEVLNRNPQLVYIPSYTSRPMRKGESEGRPYHFVTKEQFLEMVGNGDFIEYNEVHGNLYGTNKAAYMKAIENGQTVIKDIDVDGALNFRSQFGDKVVLIFLYCSDDELKCRLAERGEDSAEEIEKRLQRVQYENELGKKFDFVIENKNLDDTANKILNIIQICTTNQIDSAQIRFTQNFRNVNMDKIWNLVDRMKTSGYDANYPVELVFHDGVPYVNDGHHRVIASVVTGQKLIPFVKLNIDWRPDPNIDHLQYDYEELVQGLKSHV